MLDNNFRLLKKVEIFEVPKMHENMDRNIRTNHLELVTFYHVAALIFKLLQWYAVQVIKHVMEMF